MSHNPEPEAAGSTRREFIQKTAVGTAAGVAATAALSSLPTTAEAMRRVIGANDRIAIAHVGLGLQGRNMHLRLLNENSKANNTETVALCDLYGRNLRDAQAKLIEYQKSGTISNSVPDKELYTDYRKMLDSKGVDMVVIATSDNWHADIATAAIESGKHVYCEKPMCKTLEEGFKLYDAVKKSNVKFQVGSQGCTDQRWHIAGKMAREGKIGKVVVAQDSYMRGDNKVGEWNTDAWRSEADAGPTAMGDAHIDWETFRKGKGPKDFDPDRYYHWRKYWEYGSGLIGDLLPHRLHPLFIAMGLPTEGLKGYPMRVSSQGGLYVQKIYPQDTPERKAYVAKYHEGKADWPDREVPDFINISVDFEDCSLMAMASSINEQGWSPTIRGNKATLFIGNSSVKLQPERQYADEIDESEEQNNGAGEDIALHEKNLLDCIRNGGVPNANIDLAMRVQVMVTLAELSYRQSKTFTFDPKTRKYSGA